MSFFGSSRSGGLLSSSGRAYGWQFLRRGSGVELRERLGSQVLQDSSLPLQPGFVHGAGGIFSQVLSCIMHRVTPKGPSADSTASRSEISSADRARREPPPRPCSLSTKPERERFAKMRASRRRGT